MERSYDLIVIGGGVLGTFHAYHALRKGFKVALLEKDSMPVSATVRNFGQVVPSGMNTQWQQWGRESLKIYKSIQQQADISVRENGSVYIASNEEEMQLLEELAEINLKNEYGSQLLTKHQCLDKYTGLKQSYTLGGLFFPEEVTVEPRRMIYSLHNYLTQHLKLDIFYNAAVTHCSEAGGRVHVETAGMEKFMAGKVVLCNGSEFKLLYPDIFTTSNIEVTKLQMLQTKPQPGYTLPGSILTGWSIRRYEAFYECPSFKAIKAKEDRNSPQHTWGVHILFKQADDGSVILGDSHEYANAKDIDTLGFDLNEEINDFMIAEAKKIFDLPTYDIQNRWMGVYAQCKDKDIYQHDISNNIHIVTAIGGKGMTGSAGFAQQHIAHLLNK